MSQAIAIVGESGSGKTSSLAQVPELGIKGLEPKETFIINVKGKPLPIKGFKSKYLPVSAGGPPTEGNYLSTTDTDLIIRTMKYISSSRPDIKNVVLDDKKSVVFKFR